MNNFFIFSGVNNPYLVSSRDPLAIKYNGKNIFYIFININKINLHWKIIMFPRAFSFYKRLNTIF